MRARRDPAYVELGSRLRDARTELGMGQEELAELLSVSVPTYSRYETGARRIPLPDLVKVARRLGLRTGPLLEALGHAGADENVDRRSA